ncbi:MAG: penicillin-insensitive murein endopeptidase [Cryobacterium sp.]|nr:penicillin-insensitive murein endopeptidase [Oligoflexia bacterium]
MRLSALVVFALLAVGQALATEIPASGPFSDFLPAVAGEPPIDFCAKWNPEFAYRGYRCCSNQITGRVPASIARKGRRRRGGGRSNGCAPDRQKWTFCDGMTPAQREYTENVKSGRVDPLLSVSENMGSHGNQAFCNTSNGFLVEGRPIIASPLNRIEIRNELRCSNFGTDPMVGAIEWVGREIKREFHEPEFERARLIMGDASAPRGGCVAGRSGRRAHKSHTSGQDIDVTFFNPRAGFAPEERFTKTFYVASNWWFLKKVFKNPFACIKIIFTDQKNIRMLDRYAKDDPEWSKVRRFIRHAKGHRDHFHIRVGSGPGVPGCMSDPNLEEDEDGGDDEGLMVNNAAPGEASEATDEESAEDSMASRQLASIDADTSDATAKPTLNALTSNQGLASKAQMASVTIPPYKLEPATSLQYQERVAKRRGRTKRRRKK